MTPPNWGLCSKGFRAASITYSVPEPGLSGGEQQRLAVARALLRNSAVLILDESTSALDVPTEAALLRAVRSFRPEMTIVVISHRLKSLSWVDRFIVLEAGRIVGEGNHSMLQRENRLYQSLLDAEPKAPLLTFPEVAWKYQESVLSRG